MINFNFSNPILCLSLLFLITVGGSSDAFTDTKKLVQVSQSESFDDDESLSYSIDSIPQQIVFLQNKLSFTDYISANAFEYLSLATDFLDTQQYKNALDAALIAYYLSKNEENNELKVNSLLIISQINVFWDNPETGILIYDKVDEILTDSKVDVDNKLQLIILLGKSNAFLKLNNSEEALKVIEKAFDYNLSKTNGTIYNEFVWNTGIAFLQKGEYQRAFDSIDKVVLNSPSTYFKLLSKYYKAKSINSLGDTEDAINLYLEIDNLLSSQNEHFPERKDIYETINNYYQLKDDRNSQFLYLNKFLQEINYYSETTNYIQKNTSEYYEIPEMIRKKQVEIDQLKTSKNKNILFISVISSLLFIAMLLFLFQLRRNKLYESRFKILMNENQEIKTEKSDTNAQELSIEVISDILQKLEAFENNKEFLDKNISLHETSKRFNTNSTYLSKVVNIKKDKNFSNYINQLRIEYCLDLLKKDKKILNYTIKAIAEETGFNNAQSFSNAFYKFTGIYPSYFIEQLNKTDKK